MDLGSGCSALGSVQDNEVSQQSISHLDDNKIKDNGSCAIEPDELTSGQNVGANPLQNDKHGESVEPLEQVNLAPWEGKSPGRSSPPTTKGYGLKKWRRIKRDFVKDTTASVDSSKILKRGLSGPANSPTRSTNLPSVEIKQNSEGSAGSVNPLKNTGVAAGFTTRGSSPDSRFAIAHAFAAAATDSENSEDRSSKSSTAASAPKVRYDLPTVLGYVRDKNRAKNVAGKPGGNLAQRVQQGKGRVESTKKPRGERIKIEKENSHSSMESDSRSSNCVFIQGAFSRTSNGKQSGRAMNYDGENSDEAHPNEQQSGEEVQTSYRKENVGEEFEDLSLGDLAADSSWKVKEEKSENHGPSTDQDPLMESIRSLQSVQEVLEKEIQRFAEIGKEPLSQHYGVVDNGRVCGDSTFTVPQIHEPNSSDQLGAEKSGHNASSSVEAEVLKLRQDVKYLESKLEEARTMVEVKESRIVELESTLNISKSLKEESRRTVEVQQEKCQDMEVELESLFQQKFEAELEYLALTRTIEKLRVAAVDQIMLFEEQKALAGEQEQMLHKLGQTESRAAALKKQAEELEKCCEDIFGSNEALKTQRRVHKNTSCFFIQLILLVLVFWLFVSRLSPPPGVVVPT